MKRLVLALLIVAAPSVWANAGIPMLALAWPAQWLAFVPVGGIESFVIAKACARPFENSSGQWRR